MILTASFDNVVIYNVQDRLDVKLGETFALAWTDAPEGTEIFTNRDPVLSVDELEVTTTKIGQSLIKFEAGDTIVKKLMIVVFAELVPPATVLDLKAEDPVIK